MVEDSPLVSFIVPVYNTQDTLPRCLDSLLSQTLSDIEIIVVNDGSPDDSQSVIERYAQRDCRIRAVAKQNGGLSSARNAGLDVARGRIVDFVDSDDYVEPNLAERLVEVFDARHADIAVFGAECEPADACPKRVQELLSPSAGEFDAFEPLLLFASHAQPYVWRAAYSRAFIEAERLRFAENVRFAEDVVFQFESYPLSKKTLLIPDKLYHYVMQEKSLTHTFNTSASRMEKARAHLLMLQEVLERWNARGLGGLCPGETITWYLDLIAFDLVRMDAGECGAYCCDLTKLFARYFGVNWTKLPVKASVRRFAAKIAVNSSQSRLTLFDAARLYISTRGLKTCAERFL